MKKALLIIDIQNDYLWEKRKSKFSYDTKKVINSINKTIDKYKTDHDIIYISHLINNFPTNKLLFGFSIKGTEGAELYSKLNIVSDLKFDKYFSDAYKTKKFKDYMRKQNYEAVALCGLDQCGCVYHTALGALKETKKVYIIKEATACRYSKKRLNKKVNELKTLGVTFI